MGKFLNTLLICILLCSQAGFSQTTEIIDTSSVFKTPVLHLIKDDNFKFSDLVLVLIDSTQNLTFEQIQKSKAFVLLHSIPKPYSSKNAYWLKLQVCNRSEETNDWILAIQTAPEVNVYIEKKNHSFEHKSIGFLLPFYQHENPSSFFSEANCNVYLPTISDTLQIFIQLKGTEIKNFQINPYIYPKKYNTQYIINRNLSQGVFIGILLIMILYHLLLYRSVRDISYLHYVYYLIAIMSAFLMPFGLIWQLLVGRYFILSASFLFYIQILPAFFYTQFIQSFIPIKQLHPRLNKYYNVLKYSSLITPFVATLIYISIRDLDICFNLVNSILSLFLFSSLVSLFFIYKIKNIVSRYFVSGSLILSLLCFIGVISIMTGVSNHIPQYVMQIGVVVQILLFAIGLGKKIKLSELEQNKTQQKLILQLLENEELQTKVNRELEERVKERTHEIEQQKEEIETQRNEVEDRNVVLEQKNEEIILQKDQIEKSHAKITDSITYAKRIQSAVLPSTEVVSAIFPQHYILYKPRDTVSGDFYFIKQIKHFAILAVADCTGHGVPGAFMSMLGVAILNELIQRPDINNSALLLNELRTQIKNSLQQTGQQGETQDGMDLAFCAINCETLEMSFSGAHNPCWIFRNEKHDVNTNSLAPDGEQILGFNNSLFVLEADHMPVGVYLREASFTEKKFQLQSGDTIYLFSDGYHSQFGGHRNLPLKSKYFKELSSKICHLPVREQGLILEQKFIEWKAKNEQTDDVLVLIVRV